MRGAPVVRRSGWGRVLILFVAQQCPAIMVFVHTGQRPRSLSRAPSMEMIRSKGEIKRNSSTTSRSHSVVDQPVGLIYCPARALLHLPTWADRRRTFERVAASLKPGGRFAWNAFAFDHRIAAGIDGERQNEPVPHVVRYAVADNRVDITLDDGATTSLWWATKNEWLGLLDVSGLELEALYGGFDGEPLADDSREYIFIARRR